MNPSNSLFRSLCLLGAVVCLVAVPFGDARVLDVVIFLFLAVLFKQQGRRT